MFYYFYNFIRSNMVCLGLIFLLSPSLCPAAEAPISYSLPSVKEQVKRYIHIWSEMDSSQFDPQVTRVPRLSEPLEVAHTYVQLAIKNHSEHRISLDIGIKYFNSQSLTLENFILYNTYLAYLLTDLVKDKLDPKTLEDLNESNWRDIDAFFKKYRQYIHCRSYPFCFEGVVYTPTGVFDIEEYNQAILGESHPPISFAGLPYWGDGPHAGIVAAPVNFMRHDRAHGGMLFDYYNNLIHGYDYWRQTRNLLQKLLKLEDNRLIFRKQGVFLLNHEEPLPPTLLLSTDMPLTLLQDERIQALPLCQKRILLNWTNSALWEIESHRENSIKVLGEVLHDYFNSPPILLMGHKMSIGPSNSIDLGQKGGGAIDCELEIKAVHPDQFSASFSAQLRLTIQLDEHPYTEIVLVQGIHNLRSITSISIDDASMEAFKAQLKGIHFTKQITSRWAIYAMYFYDCAQLIQGTDNQYSNILELPVYLQIDKTQQFLRQFYHDYVECLSEEEMLLPPFEYKKSSIGGEQG